MATNQPQPWARPFPTVGIGWILAIVALIVGILILLKSIAIDNVSVGGEAILLALAILL